jgi:redox-sensitive bicupin YhaK (pirin superfamily)
MLGVQLWINLPAQNKMVPPKYHGITKNDIPLVDEGGKKIRIIAGMYKGKPGAVEGDYVKPLYLDVEMHSGAEWSLDTEPEATLFVYLVEGEGAFGPTTEEFIPAKHALLFDEGKRFRVRASDNGLRMLLIAGKPLKEPVAWGGPIVMNTKEELELAFKELKENKFIKQ